MRYLVTYDIIDDRRRTRLAKALKDFGHRVQYSVFEALLEPGLFEKMISRISKIIDPKEDSVRIYPICQRCEREILIVGQGEVKEDKDVYIF